LSNKLRPPIGDQRNPQDQITYSVVQLFGGVFTHCDSQFVHPFARMAPQEAVQRPLFAISGLKQDSAALTLPHASKCLKIIAAKYLNLR